MSNEKIKQILEDIFAEESIRAASCPFVELECWDSLRYVMLVITVQATFDIELDQAQIERITTLDGLREVLNEHGITF